MTDFLTFEVHGIPGRIELGADRSWRNALVFWTTFGNVPRLALKGAVREAVDAAIRHHVTEGRR